MDFNTEEVEEEKEYEMEFEDDESVPHLSQYHKPNNTIKSNEDKFSCKSWIIISALYA